jgi:hypothetical protein
VNHRDRAVNSEAGEALVGGGAGCRHQERVRVAATARVSLAGDVDQPFQRRPGGSVDAVAEPARELGHLRAEAADDDRRARHWPQEPARAAR